MDENILTKRDPLIERLFMALETISINLDSLKQMNRPPLNGNIFITDAELSDRLKLSRRTLQDFRTNGKLPYYLVGGKALYKESDIEKLLEDNYYPVFHNY